MSDIPEAVFADCAVTSFVLPGIVVTSAADEDVPEQLKDILHVREARETWLGTSRDGSASDARTDVGELADDDIVEIRLEGG